MQNKFLKNVKRKRFLPIPLVWRDRLLLPVIQYFFSASMLKMTNELLKSYNFPLGIAFLFYFFSVSRISFGFVAVYFLNNDKRCVNMLVLCRDFRELYLMYSFIFMFRKPHIHTYYLYDYNITDVYIIYYTKLTINRIRQDQSRIKTTCRSA